MNDEVGQEIVPGGNKTRKSEILFLWAALSRRRRQYNQLEKKEFFYKSHTVNKNEGNSGKQKYTVEDKKAIPGNKIALLKDKRAIWDNKRAIPRRKRDFGK